VELLRDGEVHDGAVTDRSGQFVIIPPRLPPGDYELTFRSRHPNGKQGVSKQSVVVALRPNVKELPVMAPKRDMTSIVLSKPSGLWDERRVRFRGRKLGGGVAAHSFRNVHGSYGRGGYRYGDDPHDGYGYGCWLPWPYAGPIYVCY
jgi:hypothetical protein